MTKRMLIDAAHAEETRVAIVEDSRIYDYDFVTAGKNQLKGNIYLAKITRVEPSLQAAFVEYGGGKQGFLPFSEIHPDYYQLPQDDKRSLIAEQIAEAEAEEAAEDEAFEREQAAREARHRNREEGAEPDEAEEAAEQDLLAEPTGRVEQPVEEPEAPGPVLAMTEVGEVALPQEFAPEEASQPLAAESFHVSSDVVETLPEDQLPAVAGEGQLPEETNPGEAPAQSTSSEEGEDRGGRDRGRAFHRRYRIQEVIRRNQIVLVQVIKEERGNKGCSLTTFISLAGRSAVLMPNSPKGGGISRKITDRTTRKRLKEIASEMRTHRGMSVIIRTAGLDRTKAEIRRDYEYLAKLWNQIREQTLSSVAPALIYEEGNLVKRTLRDLYTGDIEEIIIEGEEAFNESKEFMRMLMPSQVAKVKLYKEVMPLFAYAGIEDQLLAMTEPQVKLPSGGYIVIHPTEALISIDVNSGRSTTERNVEETALKTNVEAAKEVARQLRLRDLAGLIVVDFIDMNYGKNRKQVERVMKDALRHDRAKMQLGRISIFGLMELSRQRLRPSISESLGVLCPHCKGTGYIHSVETVGIQIIRTLEKEAASDQYATLRVTTHPDAALHLLNEKRAMLQSLEERYKVTVLIVMDTAMITGNFRLIKVTRDGKEVLHETPGQQRSTSSRGRKRGKRGGRERTEGGGPVDFSGAVEASEEEEPIEDDLEAREDDNEIIGATTEDNTRWGEAPRSDRGGRDRGDRGGRGGRHRRGGRDRNRDRGDRGNRPPRDGEHAAPTPNNGEAPQVEADGNSVPTGDQQQQQPRGDGEPRQGRRRGRRGGRGRNRERGERGPRPQQDGNSEPVAARESYEPPMTGTYEPSPKAPERPAFVIPLSEAQTNPNAIASPIKSEAGDSDAKSKRKGWWSKMVE